MECFCSHPLAWGANHPIEVWDKTNSGPYTLGEGELLGMMISRRPNNRESSEKAPGPRQTRAAAITVAKITVALPLGRSNTDLGIHEKTQATSINVATAAAIGVKYPITNSSPTVTASTSMVALPVVCSCHSSKDAAP